MDCPTYEAPLTKMTARQIFRQFRAEVKHDFAQKRANKRTR